MVGAKLHAKAQRQRRKAEKQLLDAMRPVSVQDFADELRAQPPVESALVEAKVVEMMPARLQKNLIGREMPAPKIDEAAELHRENLVLEFRRAESTADDVAPEETPADRFRRALDIERRSDAGEPVGTAEADWLRIYQNQPEYTRQRLMFEDFGEARLG